MGDEKENTETAAGSADTMRGGGTALLERTGSGTVQIVPFDDEHVAALTEVLVTVRGQNPDYPPELDAAGTRESLAGWLGDANPLDRWTVLIDDAPVGHGMLVDTHEYITDHLASVGSDVRAGETVELSKVFVSPGHRGHGLGRTLVQHALDAARDRDKVPVLAVLATSPEAHWLYHRLGMSNAGFFHGYSGVNWVFTGERRIRGGAALSGQPGMTLSHEQVVAEIHAWLATRR